MSALFPAVASGMVVGAVLGLIGGGGSILAVPLLVYFVGVRSPHLAIGTSAVAVSISAAVNLVLHARQGNVKWRCASLFAAAGVIGAWAGSTLGKATDGQRLLALFGALMIIIGAVTLRRRRDRDNPDVRLDLQSAVRLTPRLVVTGLAAGAISGYFGIGGGFLIVPGLMLATRMPLIAAVGSSLLAVTVFGLTTAANYAASRQVDWVLSGTFVAGGLLGGVLGSYWAVRLAAKRRMLTLIFGMLVIVVGGYILYQGLPALLMGVQYPTGG